MTFPDLTEKIKNSGADLDFALIKKAFDFATVAHADQQRLSGQPTIDHALAVAGVLIDLKVYDSAAIAAAILHGVLEETAATSADLENEFGPDLANLVKMVDQL